MTTTPPEALRELGAEFHSAADRMSQTLDSIEWARQSRLTFLRRCVTENTDRLAKLKEELRTLPEQIAKWEAERAHLEAQTGLDLLRAVVTERVKCGGNHAGPPCADRECWNPCERCRQTTHDGECRAVIYTAKPPGQVVVDGKTAEPLYYLQDARQFVGNCLLFWRANGAGYTTEIAEAGKYTAAQILERSPRDTDRIWPVSVIDAAVCGHVRTDNGSLSISQAVTLQDLKPAEVEAMADEAEKSGEPKMLDLRDVRYGVWCRMTDDCLPLKRGDVFRVSWRSWVGEHINQVSVALDEDGNRRTELPHGLYKLPAELVPAEPKQPALLDLRELPVGTVCEATGDIIGERKTGTGTRFFVESLRKDEQHMAYPVMVKILTGLRYGQRMPVPALVPARVVEETK